MKKSLSFCITSKNRLWQLKETLRKNLTDNITLKSQIEFVLIDFDSKDGLGEWIKNEFRLELREGYLKYFFTKSLPDWHASVAKNTAHLYAEGKIVTNLDCDNFTGKNGGMFILNCFSKYKQPIVLHQFSSNWEDGSCGRISLNKDIFTYLGGYDETFEPMAFQDIDLLTRLWKIGVRYVHAKNKIYNKAILNTKEESIAYCNSILSYEDMNIINKNKSLENFLNSKDSIRNNGKFGLAINTINHKGIAVKPPENRNPNNTSLIKHYKLQPPVDKSFILETVYSHETSN
jgi:hypothetical protein